MQIIIRAVRLRLLAATLVVAVPALSESSGLSGVSTATALATLRALPASAAVDRTSRTIDIGAGTPIRLDATIANVTIVGSDRRNVTIEIVRRAPSAADFARYPVVVEEHGEPVRISVVQADEGRDASLETDITIAAPAAAVFQAIRVFEGRVKLTNLRAACDVDLRRGPIEATRLAGRIRLEAGLGSIDVRDSDLTSGGMMRLRVFNGPVRVHFAKAPTSGRILAVTFNGRLTSDIPLTMKDKFGPRFGETTLGSGDPVMSLDVVKGDIAITTTK
jgi:hypothetical protein